MKKFLNILGIFGAVAFMLSSCEENAIPVRTEYVSEGALVKLYNHVEGSPMVNFYLNDERITANTPAASGAIRGLAFGNTYPNTYGYATVSAGAFTMAVRDTSTKAPSTYDPAANCKVLTWQTLPTPYNKLAEQAVTLDQNSSYSAFLVGTPNVMSTTNCGTAQTPSTYELLVTRDNLPPADFSKVYFRFMNTLAKAPYNFDVVATRVAKAATATTPAITEVKTVIATNIAFKEFGQYVEVPMGEYRVDFYKAGTYGTAGEVKYSSYPTSSSTATITTLALGRVYTFFLRGTYSSPSKTTHMDYWRER
ncbi:hypothetical protein [Rufibacter immobilis]|uniref:hypothetical protein n=1 Tax=Rufibacter immobilis TaxID=1348778 RepID=UPI0035E5A1BC